MNNKLSQYTCENSLYKATEFKFQLLTLETIWDINLELYVQIKYANMQIKYARCKLKWGSLSVEYAFRGEGIRSKTPLLGVGPVATVSDEGLIFFYIAIH